MSFVFIERAKREDVVTFRAAATAVWAEILVFFTAFEAGATKDIFARIATMTAAVAEVSVTGVTAIQVFFRAAPSTVLAGSALPFG